MEQNHRNTQGESANLSNSKFDNLAVDVGDIQVNEQDSQIVFDGASDGGAQRNLNVHNGFYGSGKVEIDQSGSDIVMRGGGGVNALNRVDGCEDVVIDQDNTKAYIKSSKGSKVTAMNYVTGTDRYTQKIRNAQIVIDGSASSGGIVAHTIVDGNTSCNMSVSNSTFVVRSGNWK